MAQPLPLTDLAFNILVALAEEALHGYALVKQLQTLPGRETLRTGTVYAALARLEEEGWVAEAPPPPGGGDDARRRYYRITSEGREVAAAEAARLEEILARARAAAVHPRG